MPSRLQTILIPKFKIRSINGRPTGFLIQRAMAWLLKNGYRTDQMDETENYFRFRQSPPRGDGKGRYYTVTLPDGIELVYLTDE